MTKYSNQPAISYEVKKMIKGNKMDLLVSGISMQDSSI
jgi:hypothetical protein